MEGQLIDVHVETHSDVDEYDCDRTIMLARIVKEYDYKIEIQYLSVTNKRYEEHIVHQFDEGITEIYKESITGYYDSSDLEDAGYVYIEGTGYLIAEDVDDDYSPSDDE